MEITFQSTETFRCDGYTVLPGFLSEDEVKGARKEVARVVDDPRGESCKRPNNTLIPLRWSDRLVGDLIASSDRMRRLAEAVAADDLRWISGYISTKDPHSPPLWWHQDWWCWDHPISYDPVPVQVALMCYLTDTDSRHGALRVLPSSHLRSTPLHALLPEAHSEASTTLDQDQAAMRDQPEQVTLDLKAGDAVVADYRLLHGTHANASSYRRDCLLLSFTPSWRNLPSDIRGHLIQHPALPTLDEQPPAGRKVHLLPSHDGQLVNLTLQRDAPAKFEVSNLKQ